MSKTVVPFVALSRRGVWKKPAPQEEPKKETLKESPSVKDALSLVKAEEPQKKEPQKKEPKKEEPQKKEPQKKEPQKKEPKEKIEFDPYAKKEELVNLAKKHGLAVKEEMKKAQVVDLLKKASQ